MMCLVSLLLAWELNNNTKGKEKNGLISAIKLSNARSGSFLKACENIKQV